MMKQYITYIKAIVNLHETGSEEETTFRRGLAWFLIIINLMMLASLYIEKTGHPPGTLMMLAWFLALFYLAFLLFDD